MFESVLVIAVSGLGGSHIPIGYPVYSQALSIWVLYSHISPTMAASSILATKLITDGFVAKIELAAIVGEICEYNTQIDKACEYTGTESTDEHSLFPQVCILSLPVSSSSSPSSSTNHPVI
jgi:hypothetical protein